MQTAKMPFKGKMDIMDLKMHMQDIKENSSSIYSSWSPTPKGDKNGDDFLAFLIKSAKEDKSKKGNPAK